MLKSLSRFCMFALLGVTTSWALIARAQIEIPLPDRPAIDANGVDLSTGIYRNRVVDLVIGDPQDGGLTMGHSFPERHPTYWYSGEIVGYLYFGTKIVEVNLEGQHERFTKATEPANLPYVNDTDSGSTLSESGTGFIYTKKDGTVVKYSPVDYQTRITSIAFPNGEVRSYHYVWCASLPNCSSTLNAVRLQSVTNNRGYQIKLLYQGAAWDSITGAMGINMAVDYCEPLAVMCSNTTQNWPTVSYEYNWTIGEYIITHSGGAVSGYYINDQGGYSIREPGHAEPNIVVAQPHGSVTSVTRNGRTWLYSQVGSVTAITDPAGRTSWYTFDPATRALKSFTNPANEQTFYENDTNGRPTLITYPSGQQAAYLYDARGNVTQLTLKAVSGSGLADQVWKAGYATSCSPSTIKWCNKPLWVQDPKGGKTDYTYDNAHGGVLTVQSPAGANGARPTVTNIYSPLQAYIKTDSGTVGVAGDAVYFLTGSKTCRNLSTCDNGADELRTVIDYGSSGVGNNRRPISTTLSDGLNSLSTTTTITYDVFSRPISTDGPLSGAVDESYILYDSLGRVIGAIGPDPDGAGPRRPSATRTTYNAYGMPETVEAGTVANQAATLAGFEAKQVQTTSFDLDGRATRQLLSAGGAYQAAVQTSYDVAGRVECVATRMNPATFLSSASACDDTSSGGAYGPDRITKYVYDLLDRPEAVISGFGVDPIEERRLFYAGGYLSAVQDGRGNRTGYEYDGFGRLSRTYYPSPTDVGQSSGTDYEELAYDANSQVISQRRRDGQVISLTRDALNRTTARTLSTEPANDAHFTYDNQGRVLWVRAGSATGPGIEQTYDGLGRPATRTVLGRQLSYQFDAAGRRTRLTYPGGFHVNYGYSFSGELLTITDDQGAVLIAYGFDTYNNPTGLSRGNATATGYEMDAMGRLQTLTQTLASSGLNSTVGLSYNPAGQIVSRSQSNDAAYTWMPPSANQTSTALFDGRNQMTEFNGAAVGADANGNVNTLDPYDYTFNALGQLTQASGQGVSTVLEYGPTGMLSKVTVGTASTEYVYDGGDLIAEYSGSTLLRRYVHGPGADEPLVWYEGQTTAPKYLHADERGSIIAVSEADGSAVASVKYSPYGDSSTVPVAFGYTGQKYLPSLNAYYYKARMYSPKTGRFLQPDPTGYEAGMNLYGYVRGDPFNFRDPLGLDLDMVTVTGVRFSGCGYECVSYDFAAAEHVNQMIMDAFARRQLAMAQAAIQAALQPQSQCTAPVVDRSKEASIGQLPHFTVSTFVGYGLSDRELDTVFDNWRNGSSWAPGGSPNTPDNTAYLLDGVGSQYYNWVYITTDTSNRTFTNWTLPGHIFAGRVTNSIQTVGGFSFMVSIGTGGAQNIGLNALAGPVLFKQLQESVLKGFSPLSIGNQCGRGGNL